MSDKCPDCGGRGTIQAYKMVCLECGLLCTNISAHIRHCPVKAQTPDAYKKRWNLPDLKPPGSILAVKNGRSYYVPKSERANLLAHGWTIET